LAYDGVFYQRDLESLFEVVNYTQPELLSLDCESWGYYSWGDKVPLSQNAQDIRLPGESNPALARRIADRVALDIADAAARGRPDTLLTMYDARAEDNRGYQQFRHSSFAAAGIATTPSHYGHQTSTALLSFLLRKEKKAIPTSPILPWLTYGWSGASPNDQIFEVFAHLFATGMRGFSQWSNVHIDDNRFHFALREVVGVLSSREIEAIVVDGRLAYTDFSQVTAAVLDAMELNGRYFVALTPMPAYGFSSPATVSFLFNTTHSSLASAPHKVTNLRDVGQPVVLEAATGVFNVSLDLTRSVLLLIEPVESTGSPSMLPASSIACCEPGFFRWAIYVAVGGSLLLLAAACCWFHSKKRKTTNQQFTDISTISSEDPRRAAAATSTAAVNGGSSAGGGAKSGVTPLPPFWAEARAEDGEVYYYHTKTMQTQWDRPV